MVLWYCNWCHCLMACIYMVSIYNRTHVFAFSTKIGAITR